MNREGIALAILSLFVKVNPGSPAAKGPIISNNFFLNMLVIFGGLMLLFSIGYLIGLAIEKIFHINFNSYRK